MNSMKADWMFDYQGEDPGYQRIWVADKIWYMAKGHPKSRVGPYRFCSGGTLGKPSSWYRFGYRFGYRFRGGPYGFCSDGNPTTLSILLWSYLILSDTHMSIVTMTGLMKKTLQITTSSDPVVNCMKRWLRSNSWVIEARDNGVAKVVSSKNSAKKRRDQFSSSQQMARTHVFWWTLWVELPMLNFGQRIDHASSLSIRQKCV